MEYLVVKWLHVLSSTLLFGTGIGSAFHMLLASLKGLHDEPRAAARVVRQVVWADWLFTTPTVIFQPLSGLYLMHLLNVPWAAPWILWSLALYALAGACWVPVVLIQIRMRRLADEAVAHGTPLPAQFRRCLRWWVALGIPAFVALVVVFWLMIAKPSGA